MMMYTHGSKGSVTLVERNKDIVTPVTIQIILYLLRTLSRLVKDMALIRTY